MLIQWICACLLGRLVVLQRSAYRKFVKVQVLVNEFCLFRALYRWHFLHNFHRWGVTFKGKTLATKWIFQNYSQLSDSYTRLVLKTAEELILPSVLHLVFAGRYKCLRDAIKTQQLVDRQFWLVSIVLNNDNRPEPTVNWPLGFEVAPKSMSPCEFMLKSYIFAEILQSLTILMPSVAWKNVILWNDTWNNRKRQGSFHI